MVTRDSIDVVAVMAWLAAASQLTARKGLFQARVFKFAEFGVCGQGRAGASCINFIRLPHQPNSLGAIGKVRLSRLTNGGWAVPECEAAAVRDLWHAKAAEGH